MTTKTDDCIDVFNLPPAMNTRTKLLVVWWEVDEQVWFVPKVHLGDDEARVMLAMALITGETLDARDSARLEPLPQDYALEVAMSATIERGWFICLNHKVVMVLKGEHPEAREFTTIRPVEHP